MTSSCHVFRISPDLWDYFSSTMNDLVGKQGIRVRLEALGRREFSIWVFKREDLSGDVSYYVLVYPEEIAYEDYETGKTVRRYRKEKTIIVPIKIEKMGVVFLFFCGGSVLKAKHVLEELMEQTGGMRIRAAPFKISPEELEYLIVEYGFGVKYAKLDDIAMGDLERMALWGSNLTKSEFYQKLKSFSRDPNKEVRLLDKSNQRLGTIGITRVHRDSKTLAVRIWGNKEPGYLPKYVVERILKPILERRLGKKSG